MVDAKVSWLSPLVTETPGPDVDPDCDEAILASDFVVRVGQLVFLAPKGMRTDGASIPRFFWRVVGSPFTGKYRRAAIFHDAAYKGLLRVLDSTGGEIHERLSRVAADGLFLVLMQADGAGWWLSTTVYRAVRLCGGAAWKETP